MDSGFHQNGDCWMQVFSFRFISTHKCITTAKSAAKEVNLCIAIFFSFSFFLHHRSGKRYRRVIKYTVAYFIQSLLEKTELVSCAAQWLALISEFVGRVKKVPFLLTSLFISEQICRK